MMTHTIVVGAHIIQKYKMLLVLRNSEPYLWAPPGGHLHVDEDPVVGLQREVMEELGLQVTTTQLTSYWYGLHKGQNVLAVFFLCTIVGGRLLVNTTESIGAKWFSIQSIHLLFESGKIFGSLDDYEYAFRLYTLDHKRRILR